MNSVLVIARIVWLGVLRRKDVYVLLILLGAMLLGLISLNVFGLAHVLGYVKDMGLMMAWLFGWILSIHVAARELPGEEARGTIFPLLAKPVSRGRVVTGKWLGAWSVSCLAVFCFYLLLASIVAAFGGRFDPAALPQAFLLHCLALGIFSALAVAFSTRMHHDASASLAYVLSAAAMLVLPRVPQFMVDQRGPGGVLLMALYFLMPHFELFSLRKRLVHDYGPMPWPAAAQVALYGLLFIALFLTLAWMAYRGKRLIRGSML